MAAAGLRGTSKYFEKVIVDGKSRSTCASSAVVGLGNHFGHQEDGADSIPLVHLLSAAHCAQARIRIAASRAQEYLVAQLGAGPRVRDGDVHARRVR